jgi:hypothetical protein
MIKKICLFILLCLLLCPIVEGQNAIVTLRGKVVAYVERNVDVPPHSFLPKSDVLIVRVRNSRKTQDAFIRIVVEYFSEESPLSKDVFKGEEWKFKVSRRADCDSRLIPDNSELQRSVERKGGETWTFDAPSVKFVKPDEAADVPRDKILLCYSFISAQDL